MISRVLATFFNDIVIFRTQPDTHCTSPRTLKERQYLIDLAKIKPRYNF